MLIDELEEGNVFLDEVKPFDFIVVIMESAMLDTNLECIELIKLRNAPLVFDTNERTRPQSIQHATHIKDLLCMHKIKTIETKCILKWFNTSRRRGETISRTQP